MTYDEAVKKLHEKGFEFEWGDDFGAPHETALGEGQDSPVFITHFPEKIKGFYFKRDAEKDSTVLGFDLIAPDGYGEIIGGGQREDDTETLRKRIKEHDLSEEDFQWYLDLRRFGSVPHAGYGLGLERFLTWIAGTEHVREAIPYPRMIHRLRP
jgi:asparaginyl-tRNA synthetase